MITEHAEVLSKGCAAVRVLCHDAANALSVVFTSLDLLSKLNSSEQKFQDYLQKIRIAADEQREILQRLSFTRQVLEHYIDPNLRPTDVVGLVQETLDLQLRPLLERRGVHTKLTFSDEFIVVATRADWFIQLILAPILRNSIILTPAQGAVTISINVQDERVSLVIEDFVSPIPAELHAQMFEMDFRDIRAADDGERAFGLCLPLANFCAGAIGSTIHCEMQGEKGTRYIIQVPLYKQTSR